jgi:hypothetical protein
LSLRSSHHLPKSAQAEACATGDEVLNWLRQFLQTRYVGLLEAEVARERAEIERLRAENRALLNSLLGTAGIAPADFPEAPKPQPLPRLRKRSWYQIQNWRETAAARDATSDSESAGAARANGPLPRS